MVNILCTPSCLEVEVHKLLFVCILLTAHIAFLCSFTEPFKAWCIKVNKCYFFVGVCIKLCVNKFFRCIGKALKGRIPRICCGIVIIYTVNGAYKNKCCPNLFAHVVILSYNAFVACYAVTFVVMAVFDPQKVPFLYP